MQKLPIPLRYHSLGRKSITIQLRNWMTHYITGYWATRLVNCAEPTIGVPHSSSIAHNNTYVCRPLILHDGLPSSLFRIYST